MRMIVSALAFAWLIGGEPALAESLKITNKAGGIACYRSADLLAMHGALGFFNARKVQSLIARRQCFVIRKSWKVTLRDRHRIGGADVDMVKVRLYSPHESRHAWALKANFETIFGAN